MDTYAERLARFMAQEEAQSLAEEHAYALQVQSRLDIRRPFYSRLEGTRSYIEDPALPRLELRSRPNADLSMAMAVPKSMEYSITSEIPVQLSFANMNIGPPFPVPRGTPVIELWQEIVYLRPLIEQAWNNIAPRLSPQTRIWRFEPSVVVVPANEVPSRENEESQVEERSGYNVEESFGELPDLQSPSGIQLLQQYMSPTARILMRRYEATVTIFLSVVSARRPFELSRPKNWEDWKTWLYVFPPIPWDVL